MARLGSRMNASVGLDRGDLMFPLAGRVPGGKCGAGLRRTYLLTVMTALCPSYGRGRRFDPFSAQQLVDGGSFYVRLRQYHHRGSNPLAVKACLTAGDVRYSISALAASTCLLPALMPA